MLPSWVEYFQAIGGLATAIALGFLGYQAILSKKQTGLIQEQIGRAWIGASTESLNSPKVRKEGDRLVLYCRNYGNIPAKTVWVKSAISESEIKDSDIHTKSLTKTLIFPGHERNFSTGNYPFPARPFQETSIWFGFIVRYEVPHSRDKGEYGILGKFVTNQTGAAYPSDTDEWFESKRSKRAWFMSKSGMIDGNLLSDS
jgi:hypothetical protein